MHQTILSLLADIYSQLVEAQKEVQDLKEKLQKQETKKK
jgi:hypothetical protein